MFGEALALSKIAAELGNKQEEKYYKEKAALLRNLINERLWDRNGNFYKVIPLNGENKFSYARELHGFTPWYFNIPLGQYSSAWSQLMDKDGFYAPHGPTTTEQRCPGFTISYEGHECQWNGPSWPYSTSVTLVAMANLLNNYTQSDVSGIDYMTVLKQYSTSHQLIKEDGTILPWIDENLNPFTGDWISRTRLKTWKNGTWDAGKGGVERGKDYNHSTFCDLIISGLIGIRPQEENKLVVNPLISDGWWDYFCLDNISYKNSIITVVYDKSGKRYNKGQGFMVYVNGKLIKKTDKIEKIEMAIP